MANALAKYDAAVRTVSQLNKALARANTAGAALNVRALADGLRVAARAARDRELELNAAEVRIRAERKLGEMIEAQRQTVGLARGAAVRGVGRRGRKRASRADARSAVPTLKEAGIDNRLADRARKWARMSVADFDAALAEWRREIENSSERAVRKLLRPSQRDLPGLSGSPLAASGRALNRTLEINSRAAPVHKLPKIVAQIVDTMRLGVRRLEAHAARVGEPGGVQRFQREFDRIESKVVALCQEYWETMRTPEEEQAQLDRYLDQLQRKGLHPSENKELQPEDIPY